MSLFCSSTISLLFTEPLQTSQSHVNLVLLTCYEVQESLQYLRQSLTETEHACGHTSFGVKASTKADSIHTVFLVKEAHASHSSIFDLTSLNFTHAKNHFVAQRCRTLFLSNIFCGSRATVTSSLIARDVSIATLSNHECYQILVVIEPLRRSKEHVCFGCMTKPHYSVNVHFF